MGAYLSQPKTDKVSTDDKGERLIVGASSMQGWRNSQEDAHNAIIDFDANTSFFAVYDGHGGAEVATYCADRLPDFLKKLKMYQDGQIEDALQHAFLEFDRTLLKSDVIEILKILAGEKNVDDSDNMEFEEDEEDLVELHEESHMPLNKLFEKYQGHPAMPGLQNLRNEAAGSGVSSGSKPQSPLLRGRRTAAIVAQATNKALMDPDSKPQGSSTSAAAAAALINDQNPSSSGPSKSLENRVELLEDSTVSSSSSSSSSKANNNIPHNINCNAEAATLNGSTASTDKSAEATALTAKADSSFAIKESGQNGSVTSTEKNITSSAATSSKANAADESTVSGSSDTDDSLAKQNGSINSSNELPKANADGAGISSTTTKSSAIINELSGMPQIDDDEDDAEYEINKQAAEETSDSDDDDDDDAEDMDDDEAEIDDPDDEDADSEEFDDEAEDDEDEEVLMANQQFCANMIEEPGKDSGCTAVVALLHGRDLYVANAGDSRCVVCRNGKAIEMSLDHKPEDEEESARILKAGGRVTQDGRVNGGLNLSRAIGDHAYKMNADLPLEEQMISARPDIKKLIITPEDEFMVLACDGIWNFMTSEEVVEFVRTRLADDKKRISEICEELFDNCLAPDTMGDGTGCDNMTAVIVRFQPKILELPSRLNPEETEDPLLKKEAEKNVKTTDNDINQQNKAQKRLAENSNEAEQAIKTKRLKTDIIDGSGDDTDKPNNAFSADSHKMEIESPTKTAASCSTTTTAAALAEEQNQCDSVASTVQQPTAPATAVSTT